MYRLAQVSILQCKGEVESKWEMHSPPRFPPSFGFLSPFTNEYPQLNFTVTSSPRPLSTQWASPRTARGILAAGTAHSKLSCCGLEEEGTNCSCASKARKVTFNTRLCCYDRSSWILPYFKPDNALVRVKHLMPSIHSASWELNWTTLLKDPTVAALKMCLHKLQPPASTTFSQNPSWTLLRHRCSRRFRESKLNCISAHINKKLETGTTVKHYQEWEEMETNVIGSNLKPEEMQLLKFQIQRKLVWTSSVLTRHNSPIPTDYYEERIGRIFSAPYETKVDGT